ncbi:hypothetical protein G6F57_005055 [Rhizopus arrhizus]|uniref:non-specific serine/threonine protein kinase n=1 Tax=Rhizopus oryzae TaxID=64495 RepID=A0A9P6XC28_RHIOR|nr:hypothetical protein G6F23_000589 [Rhizopus arrhizus]KAG1423917.1 hypothetical protein G6F58_002622 [Rhizopus delemar]KAG0763792.1 hypothetical protein G6F24_005741 [Rhizopus arrhizus]KAG0791785.1 hypothetical protein G6F21_004834 [Rhizopus arrhizus]KAG0798989.1 hypothetical protein G6F22_003676 [Rhizopus arrhizus]
MEESNNLFMNFSPSNTDEPTPSRPQQRAYSVTAMPSELQKLRNQETEQLQQQEKHRHNQPWWQYYYQLYHYQLPPGRKPTVFGPYLLLQTLGEGEFGKVKFGIEIKTGQEVAIKLIRKDNIDTSLRMTKVEREISVLRKLHHPNIVELYDVIETEKYIGIILQCATGGELFDYILAHRYLKEKDASRLFAQLMSGVHYMHQKHIVHRDLKLENLLLDRNRNVLITDFGFANQFSSALDDLMSTSCGSPCYAAPELVMNQGVYVGPAVDIWSCGVILFAMLCGYLPYDDDPANPDSYNINLLYKYILNTPLIFPDYISKEACDLLSLMLVPDPEKRCTMETIMDHPWLSAYRHLFVDVKDEKNKKEGVVIAAETDETENHDLAVVPENEDTIEQDQAIPSTTTTTTTATTTTAEEESKQDIIMEEAEPITESTASTSSELKQEKTQGTQSSETQPEAQIEKQPKAQPKVQPEPKQGIQPPSEMIPKSETPIPKQTKLSKKGTSKVRPKSTVSSSTEKVLHFLSGHSSTPKPTRNTNEKRTRHMSLAEENPHSSILQAKFLSSMQRRGTSSGPAPNSSASTPYKRNQPNRSSATPPVRPSSTGPRRKTLSLLVNSMTDNIAHRRQQPQRLLETRAEISPSASEQTMSDKDKHRSAGKKFIDWFKKKPLSTVNKPNSQPHHARPTAAFNNRTNDPKLRTHHGAVDQEALTSRPPTQVFVEVKQTLKSMGLEFKRDGGEYKLKCVRPKKAQHHPNPPHNPNLRMLLRRSSNTQQQEQTIAERSIIYGEPSVDPGDEVRFSIELCKIKNLPGIYIVDMRRMRGNVWAYKYLYHTLMDALHLKQDGYLNQQTSIAESAVEEEEQKIEENDKNNRISTASSGGSMGALIDTNKETITTA